MAANRGGNFDDDSASCAKIQINGVMAFRNALRRLKSKKPLLGPQFYFLRGDQDNPGFGPHRDEGAMWTTVPDTMGTLDYAIFVFKHELFEQERTRRFRELQQHEQAHYAGVHHTTTPLNSHQAEECLERDIPEEQRIRKGRGEPPAAAGGAAPPPPLPSTP